ncbi:TPA: hypothetical protein ACHWKL_002279 [Providencia stuartii]|uniref:hypothetical protein n=1 Tax=Providencia TaxID=586 RepID=UPI000DFE160E|nr:MULTISPECIES: hypothetical protein [Providencia]MCL8327419.1 hypothetical protein [Providencia thailandensis]MDF4176468.1 hypothetical protein [Providencia thailandensis]MDN0011927.1 hypothetical protein [Providencia stuartii]WIJ73697.1 hypothetical protein OI982_20035 [Providencia thailandensis]CAK6609840.1 Secreted protein [Providencia stuartii]
MKRWLVISMLLSLSSTVLGATDRYDDYLSRINSICKKHPEPANCEDEVNILLQNVLMNGEWTLSFVMLLQEYRLLNTMSPLFH